MNKYLELETKLAKRIGASFPELRADRMRWTREWNTCGLLLGQYSLSLDQDERGVRCIYDINNFKYTWEFFADHENKDMAIRCAIVGAAIAKLEE